MILNENNSRANSLIIIHDKFKKMTLMNHIYIFCYKIPSYEMLPLIFMGIEMILFENSGLEMYLLNTDLNFLINSFNYFILFICFIEQFVGSI